MSQEHYFLVEQIGSLFKTKQVLVDNKTGLLKVVHEAEAESFDDVKAPPVLADKVILALNSDTAVTVESEINIIRDNSKDPIKKGELDNLVFKGLWDFLNRYRGWAAKKLNVTELDAVLIDLEIQNIALDAKNVLDPLDCRGGVCNMRFRGTFLPQEMLSLMARANKFGKKVKIIERLNAASSFINEGDFIVHCGHSETEVFSLMNGEIRFKTKHQWGLTDLVKSISELLGVDAETASAILEKRFKGLVSKNLEQVLDKCLTKDIKSLRDIIRSVSRKRNIKICVNVPEQIFRSELKRLPVVKLVNLKELLKSRGFDVIMKDGRTRWDEDWLSFVLVGGPLFSAHYDTMNKMLKRRLKWMVSNS